MIGRPSGRDRHGPLDQRRPGRRVAPLRRNQPEQMQAVGVVRIARQDAAIQRLRLVDAAGFVMQQSFAQSGLTHRLLRPRHSAGLFSP